MPCLVLKIVEMAGLFRMSMLIGPLCCERLARVAVIPANVSSWWLLNCMCVVVCSGGLLGVMRMSRYSPHCRLIFVGGEARIIIVSSPMTGSNRVFIWFFHSSVLSLSLCGSAMRFIRCGNFSCALVPGG